MAFEIICNFVYIGIYSLVRVSFLANSQGGLSLEHSCTCAGGSKWPKHRALVGSLGVALNNFLKSAFFLMQRLKVMRAL